MPRRAQGASELEAPSAAHLPTPATSSSPEPQVAKGHHQTSTSSPTSRQHPPPARSLLTEQLRELASSTHMPARQTLHINPTTSHNPIHNHQQLPIPLTYPLPSASMPGLHRPQAPTTDTGPVPLQPQFRIPPSQRPFANQLVGSLQEPPEIVIPHQWYKDPASIPFPYRNTLLKINLPPDYNPAPYLRDLAAVLESLGPGAIAPKILCLVAAASGTVFPVPHVQGVTMGWCGVNAGIEAALAAYARSPAPRMSKVLVHDDPVKRHMVVELTEEDIMALMNGRELCFDPAPALKITVALDVPRPTVFG